MEADCSPADTRQAPQSLNPDSQTSLAPSDVSTLNMGDVSPATVLLTAESPTVVAEERADAVIEHVNALKTLIADLDSKLKKEASEKAALAARVEASEGALHASESDKNFLKKRMVKMAERLKTLGEKVTSLEAENRTLMAHISPGKLLLEASTASPDNLSGMTAAASETAASASKEGVDSGVKIPLRVKSSSPNRWGSPLRFLQVAPAEAKEAKGTRQRAFLPSILSEDRTNDR